MAQFAIHQQDDPFLDQQQPKIVSSEIQGVQEQNKIEKLAENATESQHQLQPEPMEISQSTEHQSTIVDLSNSTSLGEKTIADKTADSTSKAEKSTLKMATDTTTSQPEDCADDATFLSARSFQPDDSILESDLSLIAGSLVPPPANQQLRPPLPSTPKNVPTLPPASLKAPRKRSSVKATPPYRPKRNCRSPDRINIGSNRTKKY